MKFFDLEMEEKLLSVKYGHILPDGSCDQVFKYGCRGVAIKSKCKGDMPMPAPMPEPRPEQ